MRAASWLYFGLMYVAIFGFLLAITQQGTFPTITVRTIVNQLVVNTIVAAGVAIAVALALAIAAEKVSAPLGFGVSGGGSVASASVKVAIYAAAIAFVGLWALWIGALLIAMMPSGMPAWMSIIFIVPFLVPTIWALASEFLGSKS